MAAEQNTIGMTYDWNDIEVGDLDANNSEFFVKKHMKHEKNYQENIEFNLSAVKMESLNNEFATVSLDDDDGIENKENNAGDAANIPLTPPDSTNGEKNGDNNNNNSNDNMKVKPSNLVTEWSFQVKPLKEQKTPNGAAPRAYQFHEVYERKKKEKIQKILEEDKKLRVFHSQPMPNFDKIVPLTKRPAVHAFTAAVTPQVLKNSRVAQENRKKKIEELKLLDMPPKFDARPAKVLQKEPFVAKKPIHRNVTPEPFRLSVETRLQKRHRFDEAIQRSLQEKKQREEEERRKREEKEAEERRKLTTFKARKNPFKKHETPK